ncbi:four-carbon acid sugar kinase family protein [Ruegeria sp. 2205SS24-7]|uniref:3-oxo-tetronate kinase n=1 Tax=Ruegeria discodermiae TaxID=3064389 RepID=UPI002741F641|nr:3-oxo-tetronate kinase [Ruegeria sp. 2205SS24-7]MDP5220641.1 four-carbon acid sugar kinase family protein [Ruegeria sp. 2205SS24-7]
MLIGVIADDFTGASDIANTLVKGVPVLGGLKTAQYSGVPSGEAAPGIEAGVISLKSRTAPVEDAIRDSLEALTWLQAQGCQQIIFKVCSTFDSTPKGNIGPVAEALAKEIGAKAIPVCPAFPGAGRTVYQGHLFVFDRLLSESGMQSHPLTPMTDPDIRRWLGHQTKLPVSHLPLAHLRKGVDPARKHVQARIEIQPTFVVTDAVADEDLLTLGTVINDAPLMVGGSGIAMGLPRNLIEQGLAKGGAAEFAPAHGPGAIIAGSCSGATRAQIVHHAKDHPVYAIDVAGVMADEITAANLADFIQSYMDAMPLVYSSGDPEEVEAAQRQFGREMIAAKLDELFADTARQLFDRGYKRLVVAGGETSGAVAQAVTAHLATEALIVGPEIDPGVPILFCPVNPPVALALKSGNFGAEDFFAKALTLMGQP